MILQYSPWFVPFLLSALVTGALAVASWRRRACPVVPPFLVLAIAMTLWSLGDALEVVLADLPSQQIVNTISYIGMEAIPPVFLIVVLYYTGYEHLANLRNILLVSLVPAATVLLIATNEYHHLFYTGYVPVQMNGYVQWQYLHGLFFQVVAAYNYLVVFCALLLIVRQLLISSGIHRRQLSVLFIGALLPVLANMVYVYQDLLFPQYVSVTGIAFAVSVLIMAPGIFRYQVLSLMPVSSPLIIAAMRDGVIVIDPAGRITDLNPAAERILGMASASASGRRMDRVFPPGVPLLEGVRARGEEAHAEIAIPDGRDERVYDASALPVRSARGMTRGNLVILRDITGRKKADDALRESEKKYRELVDLLPEMVFEADTAGRLRYVNSRALLIFGYAREEMEDGLALVHGLDPPESARVLEELREICSGGGRGDIEFQATRRDGSILPVLVAATPVMKDGRCTGVRGILIDMTVPKRSEEALKQAFRRMNLLSSITRHDIQNQLTVLKGHLDLYREAEPPATAGLLRADRAVQLIRELVEFSADYQEIGVHSPEWQDLTSIVERISQSLHHPGVRIVPPPVKVEIRADPLFEKVVFNLVDNALRHGERVTRISFSLRRVAPGLVLICEDDGVGVAEAEKAPLFQKGYGKHTGLGLFLSREILAITGISIAETGTPGVGARFEITVPERDYRYT